MFIKLKNIKSGFTLIELQIGLVVLLILWLMTAGIELFLIQNTSNFINRGDQDMVLASVFNHFERRITTGVYWKKTDAGNTIDVDITTPNGVNMRYRFDKTDPENVKVYFYPNSAQPATFETLISKTRGLYISDVDPNSREIYIQLQNKGSSLTKREELWGGGLILSRTIRTRSLW